MGYEITYHSMEQDGKSYVVSYSYQGKRTSKKIPSWTPSGKTVLATLRNAADGEAFNVTTAKNAAGFVDWTEAVPRNGGAAAPAPTTSGVQSISGKREWNGETAEERARRQVYIIRQSSLTAAAQVLGSQAKPFGCPELIETASILADWVLSINEDVGSDE